jgi:hypothetical protein
MENKIRKVIREQIKKLSEMPVGKGDMNPAFKINPSKVPGTAAWDKRAGLTVGGERKPNLKSMADVDNSDWSVDGGGGNIGYMEWEDGTEMTPQEIQDYFEVNHELYDKIMQGLHEDEEVLDKASMETPDGMTAQDAGMEDNTTPQDTATNEEINIDEMKITDKDGKDVTSDVIKAMEKRLEKQGYKFTKGYTSDPDLRKDDPRYTKAEGEKALPDKETTHNWTPEDEKEQEEYDKGWYGESLKELSVELGYLGEEESDDEKSDDEGPDHGKLRTSPSGTKFRVWDKKTDMMGNPRGSTRKDRNAWGFPKKK